MASCIKFTVFLTNVQKENISSLPRFIPLAQFDFQIDHFQ